MPMGFDYAGAIREDVGELRAAIAKAPIRYHPRLLFLIALKSGDATRVTTAERLIGAGRNNGYYYWRLYSRGGLPRLLAPPARTLAVPGGKCRESFFNDYAAIETARVAAQEGRRRAYEEFFETLNRKNDVTTYS